MTVTVKVVRDRVLLCYTDDHGTESIILAALVAAEVGTAMLAAAHRAINGTPYEHTITREETQT